MTHPDWRSDAHLLRLDLSSLNAGRRHGLQLQLLRLEIQLASLSQTHFGTPAQARQAPFNAQSFDGKPEKCNIPLGQRLGS